MTIISTLCFLRNCNSASSPGLSAVFPEKAASWNESMIVMLFSLA
ncbi:hypothetical protein N9O22_06255 [Gammaproteobacteria bacterium]|nr:hypothetical protein [Gammaproteobacteria bacterium]